MSPQPDPIADSTSRAPREVVVALMFCASGAAGLIFEVVWFHRAGLVFGNSIWSTSIVLSSFMAGLALGNAFAAWFGDRISRFLRTYAALEATVAVTGIALTSLLPQLTPLLVPIFRAVISRPWLVNAIRGVIAFALLTVPATAMGATLPVLVGALSRWHRGFGRVLGRLYGWNTLGAVAGVLLAELVLIPRLGVSGSAWFAGLLNLAAAAVAMRMSRWADDSGVVAERLSAPARRPDRVAWRLLVCAFLAGGALLALEVVWFRFISLFVLNSTLGISVMLAVVLAAIAIGGLAAAAWLKRSPHAPAYLPTVALAAASVSVVSYATFQLLTAGPWTSAWYRVLWFACALTFAPSLLSGVLFTLIGEALKRDIGVETRAAGWLTLANTSGAMCGPLVATFVLFPVLGMEKAFLALALLYCAIGALAMERLPAWSTAEGRAFFVATLAAVVALARFPLGAMADTYFARAAAAYTKDGSAIVATREGPTETVFLMQQKWLGQTLYDRLVTNGFSMSGTHLLGKRYMRYFVYWPLLLHHGPLRHVLVVCYGVGLTAGAVTDLPSVESIDVAEISRDVIAMSDIIYPPAERPLLDPRVRLHVEDGRQFLQLTEQRFDLITGEPPPPLTPGTANLYTREYFQLIYDRLADGGMATYWVPISRDAAGHDVTAIIRAFCDVFEDCSLWNGTLFDWMLAGTRHGSGPVSEAEFAQPWSDPVLGPHLRESGFEVPQQIGATFLGDAEYLQQLTATTPALTDDFPRRVFPASATPLIADPRSPAALDAFRGVISIERARRAFEASAFIRRLWPEPLREQTLPMFDEQRMINRVMLEGANPLRYIQDLDAVLMRTTLQRLPMWMLDSNDALQRVADSGNDGTGMVEYTLGVRSLALRDYPAAATSFAASERRGLKTPSIRPLQAYALCLAGRIDAARALVPSAEPRDPDERHFWGWMQSRFGVGPSQAYNG